MWKNFSMILCIVIVTVSASAWAYTFNETIVVTGGGDMHASTDLSNFNVVRDSIQGFGSHWYHREVNSNDTFGYMISNYSFDYLSMEKGRGPKNLVARKGLDEKYNLTANVKNNYNTYSIYTKSNDAKLAHLASASWLQKFKSNSSVTNSEKKLSTNFDINGSGDFSELVLDYGNGHINPVISASVSGDFDVDSELNEKIVPKKDDIQILRSKLEDVKVDIPISETQSKARRDQVRKARTANLIPNEKTDSVFESLGTGVDTTGLNCTIVGTGTKEDPYKKVCTKGNSSSLTAYNSSMDCKFVGNGTKSDPYKRVCTKK